MTTSQFKITPTPPASLALSPGEEGELSFTIESLAAPDKIHEIMLQALLVAGGGRAPARARGRRGRLAGRLRRRAWRRSAGLVLRGLRTCVESAREESQLQISAPRRGSEGKPPLDRR